MEAKLNPLYPCRHEIILVNSSITLLGYFYRSIYLQISHTALICIEVTYILLHALIWHESGPTNNCLSAFKPREWPSTSSKIQELTSL
jgi:hypothetical protein